jgi:hypothetical protein
MICKSLVFLFAIADHCIDDNLCAGRAAREDVNSIGENFGHTFNFD